MENKKWTHHETSNGGTWITDGSDRSQILQVIRIADPQSICDALNDYRPWRTGVPEKDKEWYEVSIQHWKSVNHAWFENNTWILPQFQLSGEDAFKVTAWRELPPPYEIKK